MTRGTSRRFNYRERKRLNSEALEVMADPGPTSKDLSSTRMEYGERHVEWESQANSAFKISSSMEKLKDNLSEELEICSSYIWNFLQLVPPRTSADIMIQVLLPQGVDGPITDNPVSTESTSAGCMLALNKLVEEVATFVVVNQQGGKK